MNIPKKILSKLADRTQNEMLRTLSTEKKNVDFASNDYLGFATSEHIFKKTHQFLVDKNFQENGATGSRLLTGNHKLYTIVEDQLRQFHNAASALLFNAGYDANIGFFSAVPQRGDVILYDEYIHASIRDGMQMSHAKAYKFQHNNLDDLQQKIIKHREKLSENDALYVVTESVFSMDGDSPDLKKLVTICNERNAFLIVDEAHAVGVFGKNGQGLLQEIALEKKVFARIYTFGKALGCHGAAIVGSAKLKEYLVNFSRSLIYTTGMSPHAIANIKIAYEELLATKRIQQLHENIQTFKKAANNLSFIGGNGAIQCCVISGATKVKRIAKTLQQDGFDVKPIVSPTVPEGKERLRFCIHAYNTQEEIYNVIHTLQKSLANYEE